MRTRTLAAAVACGLATSLASPALAGTVFDFSADIYGATNDGTRVAIGSGSYGVIDLYLTNTSFSSLRVLNLIEMSISLDSGSFVHDDASGTGRWSAAWNIGGNPAIDSFVTLGAMSGGVPYAASLDPSFSDDTAGSVSADAGWYNASPTNGQGDVAFGGSIFIGRFVLASSDVLGNRLSVSGNIGWNYQYPGAYFDNDSQVFALPSVPGVPGPSGIPAIALLGLARRRRR